MPRAAIVSRVSLRIRTSGAGITEIVEATTRRTGAKSAGGYDPHTSLRRPPPNPDLLVWRPSFTGSTEGQQGPPRSSEAIQGDPPQPCGLGTTPETSPVRLHPLLIPRSQVRILPGPFLGARSRSLLGLQALFVGIQKLEVTSRELPLIAQALGHAGLDQCSGRDPLKHVVVPCEQLAQLRPNVGLRELWRHRKEFTIRRARRPAAAPALARNAVDSSRCRCR